MPTSALGGQGLDELKKAVEAEIVSSSGKHTLELRVDLSGPQLRWASSLRWRSAPLTGQRLRSTCLFIFRWLYKEAAVQDLEVNADDGSAVVKVVIGAAAYGRYKKLFSGGE